MLCLVGPASAGRPHQRGKAPASPPQVWKAPSYGGLDLGRSNKSDVRRVFGTPTWVGHPEDEIDAPVVTLLKYNFVNVGDFVGETWVIMNMKTGVVLYIELYPPEGREPSLADAINQLGPNTVTVQSAGPCPTAAELRHPRALTNPVFPQYVSVPARGVTFWLGDGDKVLSIVYSDKCR